MDAKIYKPTKTAMQSGKNNTKTWVLEYLCENSKSIDPVMGWTSGSDTRAQLKLKFESQEEAEKYAKLHKIEYYVVQPKSAKVKIQAYAANFTRPDVYSQNS